MINMKRTTCLLITFLLLLHGESYGNIQSSIPVVRLQYKTLSKDTFSNAYFTLFEDYDTLHFSALIRHRGASSTKYQKKSFAIKLIDDSGQKLDTSLMGMRSDNYWILDAMAVDKARMRNRVAMDLWLDFSAKPSYYNVEPKMCNGYRGKFVEVYVNDEYNGIYCLMERVDRKQLKLKKLKANTVNGVLYKAANWQGGFFKAISPYDNTSATWMRYEHEYPEIEDNLINWKPLYDAMLYADTASAAEFAEGASLQYDIPVFMDYYLFTCLLSARDNQGKNLFLSYYNINQDSKLLITPWDIDHSFGRMYNSNEEDATLVNYWDEPLYIRFERDISQYHSQLLQRYAYLRENAFSLSSLKQRFTDYFDLFERTGADVREIERWSGVDDISIDFSEEKEYIDSWLDQRIEHTDSLFEYVPIATSFENTCTKQDTFVKIICNGNIYIQRGGKTYTLYGQEVK